MLVDPGDPLYPNTLRRWAGFLGSVHERR